MCASYKYDCIAKQAVSESIITLMKKCVTDTDYHRLLAHELFPDCKQSLWKLECDTTTL